MTSITMNNGLKSKTEKEKNTEEKMFFISVIITVLLLIVLGILLFIK